MKWLKTRQARTKFCELLDDADQGRPTTILRYGRPVAVIINFDEYFCIHHGDTEEVRAKKIAEKEK